VGHLIGIEDSGSFALEDPRDGALSAPDTSQDSHHEGVESEDSAQSGLNAEAND
jgi:hypothetical protein